MPIRPEAVIGPLAPPIDTEDPGLRGAIDELYRRVNLIGTTIDHLELPSVVVTAAYTIIFEDGVVLVDTSGGPVTVTIPFAAGHADRVFYIKKTTTDVNAITLARSGADTIDGAASHIFGISARDARTIHSNGVSLWSII